MVLWERAIEIDKTRCRYDHIMLDELPTFASNYPTFDEINAIFVPYEK